MLHFFCKNDNCLIVG